ncbi:MAG TPA: protein kinase [Phycisphaerae bacterium]|nr:protein kinase [Phycisphaerae bacterium]
MDQPEFKPTPLVCPQCRSQYVPMRPTLGRRVRCRHCGHVWRDQSTAAGQIAGAIGSAASAWAQMGSTLIASADHGSTMGHLAAKFVRPPQPAAAEWVGRTLGRYEIRAILGLGAMGNVFEAYDKDLERPVALKMLPRRIDPAHQPLGLKMFLQEARVAAQIQHPNVVTVYEVGQEEGMYYFAMERVDGITLAALVDQNGPMLVQQACYVIAQAAKGLAAGHALGVIHRDVKPGNIMIDTAGHVKVTDFGLADVTGIAGIKELSERTLGTPGWISPEVARGSRPTPASDIYSLGLTLHFAITRSRLVQAKTKSGMIRAQQEARSIQREQLPSNWPPRLADIVLQCLQADPKDRYQSADMLAGDLLRALSPDEKDATLMLTPPHARLAKPVSPIVTWVVLGALLIVSAGLFVWWWKLRGGL